ncbi:MAG: hypothetical protein AAF434_05650 [Pseudomonadota bacterium]
MNNTPANGTRADVDGDARVFYDGYWIRYYAPPDDTLANRKSLIDGLTRRTFHHTEAGINTPGRCLEEAREAYESEADPQRKRVNAAMLAGALFNRATDLFTTIVDLGERGVEVSRSNELMRECSYCFREALELGKQVKHYSGEEGIDELWGEPFKAFTTPPAAFYESRYIKIAQSMRDIDTIAEAMTDTFSKSIAFKGLVEPIATYCSAAKLECETMKSDRCIFEIWPTFVAAAEQLESFQPKVPDNASELERYQCSKGKEVLCKGKQLIRYIASARVPMPSSTRHYLDLCAEYTAPF